jgi:hypothetical protein
VRHPLPTGEGVNARGCLYILRISIIQIDKVLRILRPDTVSLITLSEIFYSELTFNV